MEYYNFRETKKISAPLIAAKPVIRASRKSFCCLALAVMTLCCMPINAIAACNPAVSDTPVTVTDEHLPGSRQLVDGAQSTVNTTTPGQIKIDVLTNLALPIATYSGGSAFAPAPNSYTAVSNATQINLPATSSLPIGSVIALTITGSQGATNIITNAGAGTENIIFNGSTTNGTVTIKNGDQIALANKGSGTWFVTNFLPQGGSSGSAWSAVQGGTGNTTTPSNGQLDIGNGTGFTRATVTAGTGISVTNGSGSLTVGNSGVTSLAAGTGISLSSTTGAITVTATGGGGGGASITTGTWASRPTTSNATQRLYLPTDAPIQVIDNTAALEYRAFGYKVTPPVASGFTLYDPGSASTATTDDSHGGVICTVQNPTSGHACYFLETLNNASNYTVTIATQPLLLTQNYYGAGICVQESSSGKAINFIMVPHGGGWAYGVYHRNADTTWSSTLIEQTDFPLAYTAAMRFFRIVNNGSNRNYQVSVNGYSWLTLYTETSGTYITEDKWGAYVGTEGNTSASAVSHILHVKEGTP